MFKLFKRGQLKSSIIITAVFAIVILVVLFNIYSELVPEAQASGDSLGDATLCSQAGGFFNTSQSACLNGTSPADTGAVGFSSIPLSGILSGSGVVFVIIMAALIIIVIRGFLKDR